MRKTRFPVSVHFLRARAPLIAGGVEFVQFDQCNEVAVTVAPSPTSLYRRHNTLRI